MIQAGWTACHPHGVWSPPDGRAAGGTAACAVLFCAPLLVFMGLEEGGCAFPEERAGKRREAGHPCERSQESGTGCLQVREEAEPLLFMLLPEGKPVVELVPGDAETLTQRFYGSTSPESLREEPEDEKKAIAGIRNDEVGDDGVSRATARAGKAEDGDLVPDMPAMDEVHQVPAIIGMDPAVSRGAANGADLLFRPERSHESSKQGV